MLKRLQFLIGLQDFSSISDSKVNLVVCNRKERYEKKNYLKFLIVNKLYFYIMMSNVNRSLKNKMKVKIALILFIAMFGSFSTAYSSQSTVGDTVLWEYGEGKPVLNYVKGTLLRFDNETDEAYIEYSEYDLHGNLDQYDNETLAGYFWKSPEELNLIISEGGHFENLTVAEKDVYCVVLVREGIERTKTYHFDHASGVLVRLDSEGDEFVDLVSWEDIDVKAYADEQNKFVSGNLLFTMISIAVSIAFYYKKHAKIISKN